MANIIVIPFKEEAKAIDALHQIKELDSYGDITLYEHIIIRKTENNQYKVLKNQTDSEGWRTFTGMALGGFTGALAGPIGFIIGLYTGTAFGAYWDISHFKFENEFIKNVSHKMTIGTIAIIAEVTEDDPMFIDEALKSYSSEIIRSEAQLEYDNFINDEIEDLEEKIEEERENFKAATAQEKDNIKLKIDHLKIQRNTKIEILEAQRKSALNSLKSKTKNRIKKLESRLHNYEDSMSNSYQKARKNRLRKRIKREEEKLYQLHNALGEDIMD
ncbi:DUF1269 domain-containing protein [Winogradskyella wichelsiae]|uniref:DUF1269 domain-containing protein n=1 Tax=Winogradskyella wichelsiae TaxID=2697007 RepID=UPI003EF9B8F3